MRPHAIRRASGTMLAGAVIAALAACSPGSQGAASSQPSPAGEKRSTVVVTDDASLKTAGEQVAEGGVIFIRKGTYHESLQVAADRVTVRGEDRNAVVLDGELKRSNGVVVTGERVAVENLTVRNFLQNGVLVTGVTDENGEGIARGPEGYLPGNIPEPKAGYLVRAVTAQNNGLYGIYAFNRTGGTLSDNLASGGSDSGIYVGQCTDCNALVTRNVLVSNAVGVELANASNVTVVGNRVADNRIGFSVLSNYLEAHGPTRGLVVAGNVISENNNPKTPEQASGAFGIGIGLGGTVKATVQANRIQGNRHVGVWLNSSEDFAPTGNTVGSNAWGNNGTDVVFAPDAKHIGKDNCFPVGGASTLPLGLAKAPCAGTTQPASFAQPAAPAGLRFADVPLPPERSGLTVTEDQPAADVPASVSLPDVLGVAVPAADLLEKDGGIK